MVAAGGGADHPRDLVVTTPGGQAPWNCQRSASCPGGPAVHARGDGHGPARTHDRQHPCLAASAGRQCRDGVWGETDHGGPRLAGVLGGEGDRPACRSMAGHPAPVAYAPADGIELEVSAWQQSRCAGQHTPATRSFCNNGSAARAQDSRDTAWAKSDGLPTERETIR